MKKALALILALMLSMTLFFGCGSAAASSQSAAASGTVASGSAVSGTVSQSGTPVTIKFGIHVANPEEQEPATFKIVQAFNEKYAGKYTVEFVAADTETHRRNMKLAAQDGSLPEIFWMDSSDAQDFLDADALLDLSDFLKQYPDVDKALDDSSKQAFNSGIQYGLPYQCNVEGFFYNKAIFKELGLEDPKDGTTFDDLLNIVAKCKEGGYTAIAQGCKNSGFAIWAYLACMDRYGYSENIQDVLAGKKTFADAGLTETFTSLAKLGTAGAFADNMSTQEYTDAKELFTSGKAAMFDTGAWDCNDLTENLGENVGFWWGPTFSDSTYPQERAMKVPSAPIAVSAAAKDDAAKLEATYKFLEFYYSKDAAEISYDSSVFPATNYTGITVDDSKVALKATMTALADGWTSPAAQPDQILSSAVQTQLYDSILGVLLGNYTPEQAVKLIDDQMNY